MSNKGFRMDGDLLKGIQDNKEKVETSLKAVQSLKDFAKSKQSGSMSLPVGEYSGVIMYVKKEATKTFTTMYRIGTLIEGHGVVDYRIFSADQFLYELNASGIPATNINAVIGVKYSFLSLPTVKYSDYKIFRDKPASEGIYNATFLNVEFSYKFNCIAIDYSIDGVAYKEIKSYDTQDDADRARMALSGLALQFGLLDKEGNFVPEEINNFAGKPIIVCVNYLEDKFKNYLSFRPEKTNNNQVQGATQVQTKF